MGCRVPLKGRLVHLIKYNMVLTTLKRQSCWKTHVLSLQLALFFYLSRSLAKCLFSSSAVLRSFCPSTCDVGDAYDVPFRRFLNLSLVVSLPSPRSLLHLVQHFPSPSSVMFMLTFKCVSPSVLTPACRQGQGKTSRASAASAEAQKCFDGVSCRLQNVWRTLYIKALRL